jgi:hypothetical protein
MTITFENSIDAGANSTTVSKTHGFILSNGDVVITLINRNDTGNAMTHDQSHTELAQADNTANGESHRYGIWYKIITDAGSEPSAYGVSWTGTSFVEMHLIHISTDNSFAAGTIEDAALVTNATTDATNECSSITVSDNSFAIAASLLDTVTATYSLVDNDYTLAEQTQTGRATATTYRIYSTGASTGTTTITWVDSENALGLHFSLKEDSGGASVADVNFHGTNRGILRGVNRGIG